MTTQPGHCPLCEAPLEEPARDSASPVPQRTEGNLAVAPDQDWRNEVAHRLEAYRVRRRKLCPNSAQSDLPFEESAEPMPEPAPPADALRRFQPVAIPASAPRRARPQVDHMEIDLSQPVLDFAAAANRAKRVTALIAPVAPLGERGRAALFDMALLLLAYGGFLAMFSAVGGYWTFSKLDLAVTMAALALFYAQYFVLFMLCGGATPGMLLRGLRVVTFDGRRPTFRQFLWRSLGYVVSGTTLMLGFIWAFWDDDHLSWHDRISQTCVTARPQAGE